MSYQVLARKWRPREFSSLIGQQAVVQALTNALREGRIAQAYLFSGIRGVGKTTAARLFAKALNCERPPEERPCNECPTCIQINAGADMDVLEIDAATYSKVEQVRELSESLKYGPGRDRYKVVVLDEVHRLSRQAFDALLKIVEEPPPQLVFIFATTEIDAVPATILSRCQEFQFRRVSAGEVAQHLAAIAAAEGIRANDRALRLIARAGEGSVRDSVALLDQLATFGNGEVLEQEAARLVGGLDLARLAELVGAIVDGDAASVARIAREVDEQGWDPRQVHGHLLLYCRDALHLALGGDASTIDLPAEEAATLGKLARRAGYENLLRLLHHLLGSEASIRRSDAAHLALELAWLRAAELPKLVRLEELLAGGGSPAPASAAPPPRSTGRAAPPATHTPDDERAPESRAASRPKETTTPSASTAAAAPLAPPTPSAPPEPETDVRGERRPASDPVARFREELTAQRQMLAARLERARLDWADGELRIVLPPGDSPEDPQLARPNNRELLDRATRAAFGAEARWRFVAGRTRAAEAPVEAAPEQEHEPASTDEAIAAERVADHPRVQAVLDIFGGTVTAVEAAAPEEEEFE
jgi:DNA polymerase III subunit gamma/tau